MINDLVISDHHVWKHADDTTTSEVVHKDEVNNAQSIADCVMEWSRGNRVHLNPSKCKELRISFAKKPAVFDPVVVYSKELKVVNCIKLLGLTFSNNLTWNAYIDEVVKKVGKRLYF